MRIKDNTYLESLKQRTAASSGVRRLCPCSFSLEAIGLDTVLLLLFSGKSIPVRAEFLGHPTRIDLLEPT